MDTNLLIMSILGLAASGICIVVGTWLFRKAPRLTKIIEKLPLVTQPVEDSKPEATLLDVSKKLREFEEKTL